MNTKAFSVSMGYYHYDTQQHLYHIHTLEQSYSKPADIHKHIRNMLPPPNA